MSKSVVTSKKSLFACAMVLLMCIAAAFAYFTDREEATATVAAGTDKAVDVTTDPYDPEDPNAKPEYENNLSGKWAAENAEALANYNPGDKIDLSFALENTGLEPVDVRETFFITSSVALTESSPEFRLFQEAIQDAAGAWDGVDVISTELVDSHTIKYTIAPYALSSESETVGNYPVAVDKSYNLIFNKAALNAFQGATCKVEYLMEVKQHSNDGPAGGWTTVETATIEFGGQTINVVPDKQ